MWQPTSEVKPKEGQFVWLYEDGRIWIGTLEFEDDGWNYTNSYGSVFYTVDGWKGDAEWDDDYQPTHWMPLPEPPIQAIKE